MTRSSGHRQSAPPPLATQAAWTETIQLLRQQNQELRRAVRGFPADRLAEGLVPEVPYTAYTQFIGITQHDLYHAGQVAILRRALLAERDGGPRAVSSDEVVGSAGAAQT